MKIQLKSDSLEGVSGLRPNLESCKIPLRITRNGELKITYESPGTMITWVGCDWKKIVSKMARTGLEMGLKRLIKLLTGLDQQRVGSELLWDQVAAAVGFGSGSLLKVGQVQST